MFENQSAPSRMAAPSSCFNLMFVDFVLNGSFVKMFFYLNVKKQLDVLQSWICHAASHSRQVGWLSLEERDSVSPPSYSDLFKRLRPLL